MSFSLSIQASGGISTLQSRASGLQSITQGNSIRTTKRLRVKQQTHVLLSVYPSVHLSVCLSIHR